MTKRLSVPLDPDLRARVEAAAAEAGMPVDEWLAGAVLAYLDWQEVEERMTLAAA